MMYGLIAGGAGCCLLLVGALLLARRNKSKGGKTKTMSEEDLPSGWTSFIDDSSGYPCYVNDATGETQWEKPEGGGGVAMVQMSNPMGKTKTYDHRRKSTKMPAGWDKLEDEEGNRYYAEQESGVTSWDAPPGSVGGSAGGGEEAPAVGAPARRGTILPGGWGKDEHDGEKYYYNEKTGETTWDAPEGATGGST